MARNALLPEVAEYRDPATVTRRSYPLMTDGKLFQIDDVRKDLSEREETGIELLLSEPEIVAWLEPREQTEDDDDEPRRAA